MKNRPFRISSTIRTSRTNKLLSTKRNPLPLCHNNVPGVFHNRYTVRVEQLSVSLPNLAKLELKSSLFVENLDPTKILIKFNFNFRWLIFDWFLIYLWLLVSATIISFCALTATPLGSVNCPSRIPNSPNLQW